jgi:zinc transporter, ZIP family
MGAAIGWGFFAASSLVLGAVLALVWRWPRRLVGHVLGFGAGALIAAVSFELAEEGVRLGGPGWVGVGLAVGAVVYYVLDGVVGGSASGGRGRHGRRSAVQSGNALALGAFLDGIPEQLVLGIGIAAGEGVSVSLLVAIFVSNLPEAIGSVSDMRAAGRGDRTIVRLWVAVAVVCALATVVGYAIADAVSGDFKAVVNGFAAGALIVMLVDSMIPEAAREAGRTAGLATALGFAIATGLSNVT